MYTLFRKELTQFFGSLTGYIAILTFLISNGLFLWVFPGNFNIPDSGYATLEPFFSLAPFLYLILVPAVTMRLLSDEKRSGTMELLLTRPVSLFQLVVAKYSAAVVLVLFSLLPTLIYLFSILKLGNPPGNIDLGSTIGAYGGLFFLALIYVAIGLFSSAISENQIISYITAVATSFLFFSGLEFAAEAGVPYVLGKWMIWLSINEHYLSVSRGVIDARDLLYFIGVTLLFLMLTVLMIRKMTYGFGKPGKWLLLTGVGLIALYAATDSIRWRLDLTDDKRYSLQPQTIDLMGRVEEPVSIELFLAGEMQPGFRKLQRAILDKASDLNRYSKVPVRITITDPYESVPPNARTAFFEELSSHGIRPTDVRETTQQGTITRLLFPGAMVRQGGRETGVHFLKHNPGFSAEVNLNHSVETIEYELATAIRQLMVVNKPEVVFTQGHGELNPYEVLDFTRSLEPWFQVSFAHPEELAALEDHPRIIIVANPTNAFDELSKYNIDQLIMRGSRVMWFVDPVEVSLDSLSVGLMTLAFPRELNLTDQLFQYGVRINYDLIQDVVCSQILVNTALSGNRPEFTPQPWYFSPLLTPADHHEVGRNLNLVQAEFVSSIDTVAGTGNVSKTILLSSSPYARTVNTPASVSLELINRPPARELFNRAYIPTGVLLEGEFQSVFRNRMLQNIVPGGQQRMDVSTFNKMMVFSDGNLIANKVRYNPGSQPEILPLGYDRVSQQTMGNMEFFLHAVHYLNDDSGVMSLRNRTIKLRLLDKVVLRDSKNLWTAFNTLVPLLLVILFGWAFNFLRRWRFGRIKNS